MQFLHLNFPNWLHSWLYHLIAVTNLSKPFDVLSKHESLQSIEIIIYDEMFDGETCDEIMCLGQTKSNIEIIIHEID